MLLLPVVPPSPSGFPEGARAGFKSWLSPAFSESGTMPESKRPEACRDGECASLPSAGWNGHRTSSGAALLSTESSCGSQGGVRIERSTRQSSKTSSTCRCILKSYNICTQEEFLVCNQEVKRDEEISVHRALSSVSQY